MTRSAPSTVDDSADPRLLAIVEGLKGRVGTPNSLGDPSWHYRWEGELQLVGLDARARSVSDVRQRLLRLVHELDLRHMARRARRVLAVVLCEPATGEDLSGYHMRLMQDDGEVGEKDWNAVRHRIAVLLVDGAGHRLFGGDASIQQAVAAWEAGARGAPARG